MQFYVIPIESRILKLTLLDTLLNLISFLITSI